MAAKPKAPAQRPIPPYIAAQNPLTGPLPQGLAADPVYLAFLRGAGYSFNNAAQAALANIAAARATYNTQQARLPEQLRQANEATNTNALDRGVFSSGERLQRVNRNVVANQNAHQDLVDARAAAISNAQQTLHSAIADLARQRADAVGALQERIRQQQNQDKVIAATRDANIQAARIAAGGGGGGGSVSITLPGPPGPAQAHGPTGGAAPGPNHGQTINDYLSSHETAGYVRGLAGPQQSDWFKFMQAAYPGADFRPLLLNIAAMGQPQSVGVGGAGRLS